MLTNTNMSSGQPVPRTRLRTHRPSYIESSKGIKKIYPTSEFMFLTIAAAAPMAENATFFGPLRIETVHLFLLRYWIKADKEAHR